MKISSIFPFLLCLAAFSASAQITSYPPPATATVSGISTLPANATNAVKGIMEGDGVGVTCVGGVCSQIPGAAVPWTVEASAFNVVSGNCYSVDTSSASVTATLPAAPSVGNWFCWSDGTQSFSASKQLIINVNTKNAFAQATNLTVSSPNLNGCIYYRDVTNGWMKC